MLYLAELNVPNIVLFPDTIDKMRAAFPDSYQPDVFETREMEEAVKYAAEHTPDGSVTVLSTAAPSYSLWRDFEEKGDQFQAAVNAL
jgi:UDP-N-acetylmuramoylalanine--D-glutamate ligase